MDDIAVNALKESIAHWERMRDNPVDCGEAPYADDCPLCRVFWQVPTISASCCNCPVFSRTRKSGCVGTPYTRAEKVHRGIHYRLDNPEYMQVWTDSANDEINFLKSLLPQEEQTNG